MVPAESLGALQLERMRTASAYACLNEGIVVDVFVSQLAESVTAGFVLDDTIYPVTIGADGQVVEMTPRKSRG